VTAAAGTADDDGFYGSAVSAVAATLILAAPAVEVMVI